jgi:hypothetical protein
VHKSTYTKEQLFLELGLPENAKICLVLGRLFKLHPDFDKLVISLLASAESYYNKLSRGKRKTIYF